MSSYLVRLVLFGTLAVPCALAATDEKYLLAVLFGLGAVFAVGRLVDRKANERRELPPKQYKPLLDEDNFTVGDGATRLARRREPYFRQSMDMARSGGQSLHPANAGRLPAR